MKNNFKDCDFTKLQNNFYNIDKDYFLKNKPLEKRLSTGTIKYESITTEIEFYETIIRYLTRMAVATFSFVTQEKDYSVDFNMDSHNSYCSLITNNISIGINSLQYDSKVPFPILVDNAVATIFHEMYHKTFTIADLSKKYDLPIEKYYSNKKIEEKVTLLFSNKTFNTVFNILEDRRIEMLGAMMFPGYVFFFEESRKYCYYLHSDKNLMPPFERYFIEFLLLRILLPELVDDFLKELDASFEVVKNYSILKGIDCKKEEEKFSTLKKTINKVEEYILKNDKLVFSESFDDVFKAASEIVKIIPKNIKDIMDEESTVNDFSIRLDTSNVSEIVSEDINTLVKAIVLSELDKIENEDENKIEETKIEVLKNNKFRYTEYEVITSPKTDISINIFNKAKKLAKDISSQLGFIEAKFARDTSSYELTEGELDDDELYSLSFNNKNVFQDVDPLPEFCLDFGILIDESASMSNLIIEAKVATLALMLSLKDIKHINLFVYGHTANDGISSPLTIQIYKYFNSIEQKTEYKTIFSAKARRNNADGFAINKVADEMKISTAKNKILVVVSDGKPNAINYEGRDAISHVKSIVSKLEREGITVIQLCMANIDSSKEMFTHYVPYNSNTSFFDELKKILLKKLSSFIETI